MRRRADAPLGSVERVPPTDLSALLNRAANSDTGAFASFYDATIDDAHLLARMLDSGRVDVDDIVRDAYLNAWLDSASFDRSGLSARTWMMVLIELNAAPLAVS